MVREEREQKREREPERVLRVRRPDGARHREQVVAEEVAPEAALRLQVADRRCRVARCGRDASRPRVEAQNIGRQAVDGRSEDLRGASEESGQTAAAVLDPATTTTHRERHVAGLRCDVELPEESRESRIGALVEDDEPRVYADSAGHGDRARVPTGCAGGLVHGHVVACVQRSGRDQARDPTADNGYPPPHRGSPGSAARSHRVCRAPPPSSLVSMTPPIADSAVRFSSTANYGADGAAGGQAGVPVPPAAADRPP